MVFSGIVEETGEVVSLERHDDLELWDGSRGEGFELRVRARVALEGATIGCSIAVDGTCLTVKAFDADTFLVGLAPETYVRESKECGLRRTSLAALKAGDRVNLERSLPADGRNSGHFVQGHVDGTASIVERWREGESLWVRFHVADAAMLAGIVPKGYVAIDGTSLTVCDVDRVAQTFTVMLIEFTQRVIVLPHKPLGARVNIEVDVLGKYVERAAGALVERVRLLEEREKERTEREKERAERSSVLPFLLAAVAGIALGALFGNRAANSSREVPEVGSVLKRV